MHLPNVYLDLAIFIYITGLVLFMAHHFEGRIKVYLRFPFINFMILLFYHYIYIYTLTQLFLFRNSRKYIFNMNMIMVDRFVGQG